MAVGLTGVGGGSITAPVLILFFGLPPAEAVGTALAFTAVIKLAAAPLYLARRQVSRRILLLLCVGGVPGVLAGVWLIGTLNVKRYEGNVFILIGGTIAITALFSLYRALRVRNPMLKGQDHSAWLPFIACGIGAETGFSSAGAGALGSLALLNLTALLPSQIVGTDMMFGLVMSSIGGGLHVSAGHFSGDILWKLIAGGLAGVFVGAHLSSVL